MSVQINVGVAVAEAESRKSLEQFRQVVGSDESVYGVVPMTKKYLMLTIKKMRLYLAVPML
jgi:hypothetical protein